MIFLQDDKKWIHLLLSKGHVSAIAISQFYENASSEFFRALIFEPVYTNQEYSPTALVYLAISPQFYGLKLPTYSLSGLHSYLKQNKKLHHLFCAEPIKQAIWYNNNGFELFYLDPNKQNKVVPNEFQQSIFNYCQAIHYCYNDGLQYDKNNCRKDSLKFLYLKSNIKEDQYFLSNILICSLRLLFMSPHMRVKLPILCQFCIQPLAIFWKQCFGKWIHSYVHQVWRVLSMWQRLWWKRTPYFLSNWRQRISQPSQQEVWLLSQFQM